MPDIIVRNQTELDAALKAARGGETIKLAAGAYTSLIMRSQNYASAVVIESLDPNNKANIKTMDVSNSSNVTFKNLDVVKDFKPAEDWAWANRVINSQNVTLDGVNFSGGTGDVTLSKGSGLFVRDSAGIKINNSSFDHFVIGLQVDNVDGMVVSGNSFHDNRRDHTNFAEMNNVVIDGNVFTNLFPINGEHPDNIQFMTNKQQKANSNITITNNIIMQGSGGAAQGIFMNEEDGNLPYTNVKIKNNIIYSNGIYHGINLVNARDVEVDSNTVISKRDSVSYWIRLDKVDNGKVTNNVTDSLIISDTSTNISSSNNVSLATDSVVLRKLYDIDAGATAKLANLIVSGVGYQPPVGSLAAAQVAAELAASPQPTGPNLLLDLQFGASGLLDQSRWSSDETVGAVDLSAIKDGMFQVKTGTGFQLSRDYSRQMFALSAFTLSFDLKRQSATAAAGQIMGVNQSWAVSLRADGELTFTLKNAAGTNFTLVTSGAKIVDTNVHKISLTYDSVRGRAVMYVDGLAKGTIAVSGSTRAVEYAGLYVGSQFSSAFQGGVGDVELRDAALSASEILSQQLSSSTGNTSSGAVKYSLTKGVASNATALIASGVTTASAALASVAAIAPATTLGAMASAQTPGASALQASAVRVSGDLDLGGLAARGSLASRLLTMHMSRV